MLATPKAIFRALVQVASPFIVHYRRDLLKHDRRTIYGRTADSPFLHFTYPNGTHLVPLPPATAYPPAGKRVPYLFGTADREHLLREKVNKVRYCCDRRNGEHLVHHYDNGLITRISSNEAIAIAGTYATGIRAAWSVR